MERASSIARQSPTTHGAQTATNQLGGLLQMGSGPQPHAMRVVRADEAWAVEVKAPAGWVSAVAAMRKVAS